MPLLTEPIEAAHILGIDLGTTNLRVRVAHYDHNGVRGEASMVALNNAEAGGAVPMLLEMGSQGQIRRYGREIILNPDPNNPPISEFKPCIGQSQADLLAQGRAKNVRYCRNPNCSQPGFEWPAAVPNCGFCLQPLPVGEQQWAPIFRYTQAEALEYAGKLLRLLAPRLANQLNTDLTTNNGYAIVAGVPVHWQAETLAQFEAMLATAFPNVEIWLDYEPMGALRLYAHRGLLVQNDPAKPWTLLVDFGGGTTDLVMAKVDAGRDHLRIVQASTYGERYGGADFDLILAQYAAEKLRVQLTANILPNWRTKARELKELFSDRSLLPGEVRTAENQFQVAQGAVFEWKTVTLNQEGFDQAAGQLVDRFSGVLSRGLAHFGEPLDQIGQVVLTGGGSGWYFVRDAVKAILSASESASGTKEVVRILAGIEPVNSISMGLALAGQTVGVKIFPVHGADIQATVEISYDESQAGCHKQVGGVVVTVPARTETGQMVRVAGKGQPGRNGGANGDLVVTVKVADPLPVKGADRHVDATIPLISSGSTSSNGTVTTGGPIAADPHEYTKLNPEAAASGVVMKYISGGTHTIGGKWDLDAPLTTVTLDPYWLSATPITVKQFKVYDAQQYDKDFPDAVSMWGFWSIKKLKWRDWYKTVSWSGQGDDDYPVVGVTWQEADAYCRWAGGRLPSEAQFERGSKGTDDNREYPWAGAFREGGTEHCWYNNNKPASVNRSNDVYKTDEGLIDMAGNVWQWCQDWYKDKAYSSNKFRNIKNPIYDNQTTSRVLRGGSWCNIFTERFRTATRHYGAPGDRLNLIGFRLAGL
jgi:formylglycine-generating enzyme required for sulfatase activity